MTPIPHPTGDAGATNTPDSGPTAAEGIQAVRDAISASSDWERVEALAALLEPEAFNPDQPADETWRYVTQQRALGHAETVIMSDWRRVVEDDDTIERLAKAMWFGPPEWTARIVQQEYAPTWRAKARAVVRALREDT